MYQVVSKSSNSLDLSASSRIEDLQQLEYPGLSVKLLCVHLCVEIRFSESVAPIHPSCQEKSYCLLSFGCGNSFLFFK